MSKPPTLTEVPKVSVLPVVTSLDLPTERILQAAINNAEPLQKVVVIGYDSNGEMYFASSVADGPEVLWLLEKAKLKLLNIGED